MARSLLRRTIWGGVVMIERKSGKVFYRLYWDRQLNPVHGRGSAGEDGTEMRALAAKHWRRLSEKPEAVN